MENMQQFWPWAIAGSISIFVYAAFSFLTSRPNRADERLDQLRDPSRRNKDKDIGAGVLGKAAPALSKALQPKTELEQDRLKIRMANAGFSSPNAAQIYLALKFSTMIAFLVFSALFAYVRWGVGQNFWVTIGFATAAGMFLPEIILAMIKSARQTAIFRALPDTLDLLVVCVEAGLGLDAAMRRVAEEMEDTSPEVCQELNTANMQLQMGRPRREVLHDLGVRTGVDDMRSLAAILIQADKFGSSIAQALRVQSDSMRVKRRQMAEEKAQQTAVKLIFPLVLFIFPGIFVVLVGPAAIQIMENLIR